MDERALMLLTRRIPLLLTALGVAVLLSWFVLERFEQRSLQRLYAGISAGRQEQLGQALVQTGTSLRNFTQHHSARRTLQRIQANDRTLDNLLADYDIAGLWVVNGDGTIATTHPAKPEIALPPLPPAAQLAAAFAHAGDRNVHFFLRDARGGVQEVYGHTWKPHTPEEPPLWLLGLMSIDPERLQSISYLSGTYSRLTAAHEENLIRIEEGRMHFHVPLPGVDGAPVALLDADYRGMELDEINERIRIDTWIFLTALVGLLTGVALSLRHWVVLPLRRISRSLLTGDTAALDPLDRRADEYQHIAGLIRESFATREELRRTMEERARLGRDLHDGAIQSIYAAGMSLTRARALAQSQPEESARIIESTRLNLNATIQELREFISQAEREPLAQRQFAAVAEEVLGQLQTGHVQVRFEIDEAVAAQRTVFDRLQILQVIREASSNALRHGGATELLVRWQGAADGSDLEIKDNGRGFPPQAPRGGHGLENMTERARLLGGTLRIDSEPGRGTRVLLHLPSTPPPP
jgi:signal transduction histidine kinase